MNSRKYKQTFSLVIITVVLMLTGCEDNYHPISFNPAGKVSFTIRHHVDGTPLVKNQMIYENAAGNRYMVTELRYFISDITLHGSDGIDLLIDDKKSIFYVDDDIPSTLYFEVADPVAPGKYDSITLTFGISEEKNISNTFVNPPEVNMFWPEVLGGGYHYMMLNGKWLDKGGNPQPFNFHLGIGQLYYGVGHNVDSIYAFVQNYFSVTLPASAFTITEQEQVEFVLTMNLESWFDTPTVYDHDFWGGAIMQNQDAMNVIRANGRDVFTLSLKE